MHGQQQARIFIMQAATGAAVHNNRVLMQAQVQANNKVEMVMQRMYRMCRLRR
jgi:hypothetical protein